MARSRTTVLALLLLLFATACRDATGPQANLPGKLNRITAAQLEGEPGFKLAEPVTVQVLSAQGKGIANQNVSFKVTRGGGSVSPATAITDSAGIARAEWTLGPNPGDNELEASAEGVGAITFRANAVGSPGDLIAKVSGGGTSIVVGGCPVQNPLVVRVTDRTGRPVPNASVEFVVDAGGGRVTPDVARTGANGEVTAVWNVGIDGGTNTARAVLRAGSRPSVSFFADAVGMAPGGYATIGNKIYNSSCLEHLFHGVARPSLQWHSGGDDRFVNVAEDFALIKSWRANVARIALSQTYWLPGLKQYDPTYKQRVIETVQKARTAGLAVILDLHVSDRGNPAFDSVPDVQQMPDERHSLPFWKDVANTFKNDGGVIFELYNEPHDVTWDVWLNGGDIAAGPKYAGGPFGEAYRAIGMQQLYDAVRATGARNLVIVSGTHWGYFLDGVPTHKVRGYNIVYGTHPYDWPDKQPDTWEQAFGFLAATEPVIITEFGAYDCNRLSYYTAAMDYADRKGMSWVAWAWWTPPAVSATYTAHQRAEAICKFPALINDWTGTPSPSGMLIKARLATYR